MANLIRCLVVGLVIVISSGHLNAQVSSDVFSPVSSATYNKKVPIHVTGKPDTLVFIFIYGVRNGKLVGPPRQFVGRFGPTGVIKSNATFPEGEFEMHFDFKYPVPKTIKRRFKVDHFKDPNQPLPEPGQEPGDPPSSGTVESGVSSNNALDTLLPEEFLYDATELALLDYFDSDEAQNLEPVIWELGSYGVALLIPTQCDKGQLVEIFTE